MNRIVLISLLSIFALSSFGQGTVTTVPPLISNNGQSGITCNLSATGVDIVIDSLSYYLNSGTATVELWYNTAAISGPPGAINPGNGWTSLGSWTATGSGSGLSAVGGNIGLTIPAGSTYGFFVSITSGPTLRYMTYSGGATTFTDGTLTIETGPNVGYGGPASGPTFSTRQFLGAITYELGIRGEYDAGASALRTASTTPATSFNGYREIPLGQNPSFEFSAKAKNLGDSVITGIKMDVSVLGTSYVDSFLVDTLLIGEDSTSIFPNSAFTPATAGLYRAQAIVTIAENDTVADNDTAYTQIIITDTVLARDDSIASNGIGNNSVIEFGHKFKVWQTDTMSTASFYLNSPQVGTQVRLRLYTFNDSALAGGLPGPDVLIDSSRVLSISSSTASWYSLEIGCGGHILTPGDYFLSVVQANPTNMGLGYSATKASPDTFLYLDFYDGVGFRDGYHSTVNPLVANITLMLRSNFGRVGQRNVLADSAMICFEGTGAIRTEKEFDSYTWSNNSLYDSIVVGSPGYYTVNVFDEIGCAYEDSIYVRQLPQMGLSSSSVNATCGNSDGSATALATGSYGPYTYEWSTGATTSGLTGIAGDIYSVTATDTVGCARSEQVTVLGANPTIAGSFTYRTCAGDADGSASVSVTSGIPSYSYIWAGGGSNDTESNLSAGSYSVTVTDSSNCSATITVTVMDPDTLALSTANSSNPTACGANNGVASVLPAGGVPPYSYTWSNGQNQSNSIDLTTGTYDVTVVDANNCVRTESVTLIDPNAPTVSSVGSTVTCSYDLGNVAVNISGGTSPYAISWDNGSNDSSQTNLPVGIYNVVVIDGDGCVKTATANVDGPDDLDIVFTQSNVGGQGKADITASIDGANQPYSTYQWRVDNGSTNADVVGETDTVYANAPNNNYWLVVTDAQACVDSATVQVNVPTGLLELSNNFDMNLFPNPNGGDFQIVLDVDGKLEILAYDVRGRVIYSETVTNYSAGSEHKLNFVEVPNGMYLISVQHKEGTSFSKVQLNR